MKKKYALAGALALATSGLGVLGFAPQSSAQHTTTIGGCADPEVCGFINASGFFILGFAGDTFGFIGPGFGTSTTPVLTQPFSTAGAPTAPSPAPPAAPDTGFGQWSLGSMPVASNSVPSRSSLLSSLPQNLRLAGNAVPDADNGVDPATASAVVLGLMGLYGASFAIRRRAIASS